MTQELTPRQIVSELDKFIIGQDDAKRAVAVAVRNRWRRQQLEPELACEVAPKNIIMIGPTGVGKTEIARRLAKLVDAPFIKVEASKYTEVGYHGRDVESMIRDLLDLAINMARSEQAEVVRIKAESSVEHRLVSILLGEQTPRDSSDSDRKPACGVSIFDGTRQRTGYVSASDSNLGEPPSSDTAIPVPVISADSSEDEKEGSPPDDPTRKLMLKKLREGLFDDKLIEIQVQEKSPSPVVGGMGVDQMDPGMIAMIEQLMPAKSKMRKVTVQEARRMLLEEETEKLIDHEEMVEDAITRTEQTGLVFLDEIDKIASGAGSSQRSADVSRQGVQRDLLPIVEGSTVSTRYGMVRTDHILFIAAGAFHSSSVSDLMPELQGRFPIRVELNALTGDDFIRILREPEHSLIKQQHALLATEGLDVAFTDDSIEAMAQIAEKANSMMENIGARRLMTVVERLFEEINYNAPDMAAKGDTHIKITAEVVNEQLKSIAADEDLSKFVL